jgi:hypothetical protein
MSYKFICPDGIFEVSEEVMQNKIVYNMFHFAGQDLKEVPIDFRSIDMRLAFGLVIDHNNFLNVAQIAQYFDHQPIFDKLLEYVRDGGLKMDDAVINWYKNYIFDHIHQLDDKDIIDYIKKFKDEELVHRIDRNKLVSLFKTLSRSKRKIIDYPKTVAQQVRHVYQYQQPSKEEKIMYNFVNGDTRDITGILLVADHARNDVNDMIKCVTDRIRDRQSYEYKGAQIETHKYASVILAKFAVVVRGDPYYNMMAEMLDDEILREMFIFATTY